MQEFEAAAERAKADKQKAKLSADVERLKQQLVGLSDQAAAKQAAVNLELQKSKLQKELALQVSAKRPTLALPHAYAGVVDVPWSVGHSTAPSLHLPIDDVSAEREGCIRPCCLGEASS